EADTRGTQERPGDAVGDQGVGGKRAGTFHALAKDRVLRQELVDVAEERERRRDLFAAKLRESRLQVALQAADADVVGRQARAAKGLVEIVDLFARLDAVEKRRQRRELERARADAGEVIGHARQLGGDG